MDLYLALREPQAVSVLKSRAHQKTSNVVAKGNFEAKTAAKFCAGYERHIQMVQVRGGSTSGEDILKKKI